MIWWNHPIGKTIGNICFRKEKYMWLDIISWWQGDKNCDFLFFYLSSVLFWFHPNLRTPLDFPACVNKPYPSSTFFISSPFSSPFVFPITAWRIQPFYFKINIAPSLYHFQLFLTWAWRTSLFASVSTHSKLYSTS